MRNLKLSLLLIRWDGIFNINWGITQTLIKCSVNTVFKYKLSNDLRWFMILSNELCVFFPRVLASYERFFLSSFTMCVPSTNKCKAIIIINQTVIVTNKCCRCTKWSLFTICFLGVFCVCMWHKKWDKSEKSNSPAFLISKIASFVWTCGYMKWPSFLHAACP